MLCVKWPNDILSGDKKICGVLIENMFKGSSLHASIVGIGLNVNQENFKNLPRAASMLQISGTTYDLHDVLATCLDHIRQKLELLNHSRRADHKAYMRLLYIAMENQVRLKPTVRLLTGIIRGVSLQGLLKVQLEDSQMALYDLKTIQLKN